MSSTFKNIRGEVQGILTAKKAMSNADLLNLHLAAVEIIPTPGPNKTIKPLAITIKLNYVAPVFSTQAISFKINTVTLCQDFSLNTAADNIRDAGISTQVNTFADYPLMLSGSPSLGGGNIEINVSYIIVDLN